MDEQHAQLLPVPLTRLFIRWRAAVFFSRSTYVPRLMHSLSPPHPEILSHRTSFEFLGEELCIRHEKKTYNDLWTFCDQLRSSNGHFFVLVSLERIFSMKFEIPEWRINWHLAGGRVQGRQKLDSDGGWWTGGLRVFWVQFDHDGCCGRKRCRCSSLAAEAELMRT